MTRLKWAILLVSLISLASAITAAQNDDPPSPTPVQFTPEPKQLQWRLGFDLGNAVVLETPELNPENETRRAVEEAERIMGRPFLDFCLALLPATKVAIAPGRLVNPRQWTVLDLHGKVTHKTFQALGTFMGRRMTSTEGGYHLVSVPTMGIAFMGLRKEPAEEGLIFGFAGPVKGQIQIHPKLSETKWENLLPVEDPAGLPAGWESAKQLLDDHSSDGQTRFLYGTSIEALIRNRLSKLWLLNYSHPDTTMGTHPWGVFVESAGSLEPLYIYKPASLDNAYVAYFVAAVDLNQDGSDELVIEASYRIGTAYKVISSVGGKYQETFTSYYRGPAS